MLPKTQLSFGRYGYKYKPNISLAENRNFENYFSIDLWKRSTCCLFFTEIPNEARALSRIFWGLFRKSRLFIVAIFTQTLQYREKVFNFPSFRVPK